MILVKLYIKFVISINKLNFFTINYTSKGKGELDKLKSIITIKNGAELDVEFLIKEKELP